MDATDTPKFVAALDVGTTTIRCIIFDDQLRERGAAHDEVQLLYPEPGQVEIDPEDFWERIRRTIANSFRNANVQPHQVACMGISTQRSTFITWDKETGRPYHNFITWKDLRADSLVTKWNSSVLLKSFHAVTGALYKVSRVKRFLAGSVLRFMNTQATARFAWMIQNNDALKRGIKEKRALFGTVDTWLLGKLSPNAGHLTDVTNATATGFYDPFMGDWAGWSFVICGIVQEMLPKVVANDSAEFGAIDGKLFGHTIPIRAIMGDQPAALWGSSCFGKGDLKVTLGTGAFLDLNTGSACLASVHGLYPMVAWRLERVAQEKDQEIVYLMEGGSSDTGSLIKWAMSFGLFEDPKDSAAMALSVPDPEGVFFIPAFSGLGPPVNDHQAATGILGIHPNTRKEHIVRAILESIAFRVIQLFRCTLEETNFRASLIRVDGGVSNNDFVCQAIADLSGVSVERAVNSDASAIGVASIAGLNGGVVWRDRNELMKLRRIDRVFEPDVEEQAKIRQRMARWEMALNRFKGWHSHSNVPAGKRQ